MREWSDYFFMVGTAAASLIGLMFIVVTLTAGRDRRELEAGKKLYTTPIVWHLGAVVVICGASIAPSISAHWLGISALVIGGAGCCYGTYIAIGILRAQLASNFSGYDAFWYGVAPALLYTGVVAAGYGDFERAAWANTALAGAVMALLLLSIHNEWDLVTYLAPDAASTSTNEGGKAP